MENLQNQNQQNNFNQIPQQNHKKQIASWIGFVIIVAVAVIAFGGVFAYQYFLVKNYKAGSLTQQTDRTAGWKTYDFIGFWGDKCSIKYPNTWELGHDAALNFDYIFPKQKTISEDIRVAINCFSNSKGYVNPNGGQNLIPLCPKRKFSLSWHEGFEGVSTKEFCTLSDDGTQIGTIQFQVFGGRQSMGYYIPDVDVKSELEILNQMMTTFKFENLTVAEFKSFSMNEYGIKFNYAEKFSIYLQGPNQEQRGISDKWPTGWEGYRAAYETVVFSDSDTGDKVAQLDVLRPYDGDISVENYNTDPGINKNGLCDVGWKFRKGSVEIEYLGGIKTLKVQGIEGGTTPLTCYYFKNLEDKLVVLSIFRNEFSGIFSGLSIFREKPLTQDEITKKYNAKFGDSHWAQLTKTGDNENYPVVLSQAVDTPSKMFQISFNYGFLGGAGTFDILLNSVVLTTVQNKNLIAGVPPTFKVIVNDPYLYDLKKARLEFRLFGPDGTKLLLTNISMSEL